MFLLEFLLFLIKDNFIVSDPSNSSRIEEENGVWALLDEFPALSPCTRYFPVITNHFKLLQFMRMD